MSDTIGKIALHVHHSGLPFEILTEPLEVRADYIKTDKPDHEVALRLRLLKVIEAEPPKSVAAVLAALADYGNVRAAAWADYGKGRAAAWADYDKVRDAAWADYGKVCAAALADCGKGRDAAWADYDKVCAAALADYGKVRDAALADYDKVRVAAWADYDKVRDSHLDEIAAFHKLVCVADCPWTPENQTIFPEEQA